MISGIKKKISVILASAIALTFTINLNVNADENESNDNIDNSAYLEYDDSIGNYRLYNENGEEIDYIDDEQKNIAEQSDDSESAVTTVVTTAPLITGVVYFTTVSTKPVSPATTVPQYSGRQRSDALSERQDFMNSYTTTTTTTTTTKATTKKTTQTTVSTKAIYKGIDVSRHQGDINWKKVKSAGVEFVMIRAGYGMMDDQVDAKFHENIKAAQAVGIDCGVYWYSYALNTSDALREAKVCYNTIKNYKLTYPVSFDIEDPSQSHLTMTEISNITKTFCNYLQDKKYYVSVYSYASMLSNKMNASVLSSYDIWVAHTGVSKPNFSGKYGMWQYSWKGSISGISGDVDLDYSYKYYPEIIKKNKLNGF